MNLNTKISDSLIGFKLKLCNEVRDKELPYEIMDVITSMISFSTLNLLRVDSSSLKSSLCILVKNNLLGKLSLKNAYLFILTLIKLDYSLLLTFWELAQALVELFKIKLYSLSKSYKISK